MTLPPSAGRPATEADRSRLVARLRNQATSAADLGSPMYATLLRGAATAVDLGGPCWRVMSGFADQPDSQALPLRFMAGVHRLVLRRHAPALAMHYPSVGGTAGLEGLWSTFLSTVANHAEELIELTGLPCQTNEVGRSAALGPGLAWLAVQHDLPLHHREIGTSAGLNLRWDAFRYGTTDGTSTWGPADSPVDLVGHWVDPPTDLPTTVEVASREGCDPNLLDPASQNDRETLTAAVWADMPARHGRLKGALALAEAIPATTTRAGAGEWLADVLPDRPDGLTVVSHSVVWRYVPTDEQDAVIRLLDDVGGSATASSPLVWLRLEPRPPAMVYDGTPYPLLATTWPGGETVELGVAQAHGQDLRWSPRPFVPDS